MLAAAVRFSQHGVAALAVALLLFFGVGPHLLGYRTLAVLSGSMTPSYPTGSEVVDTSIPTADLRIGDVLTYHIPVLDHHVESHRVIRIQPDGNGAWLVWTKGDHNPVRDPWIAQITGRRVWVARFDIPWVGTVIRDARSPVALRILQWVAPLLALLWLLRGLWLSGDPSEEIAEAGEVGDAPAT